MGNMLKKKAERLTDAPPCVRYVVPNHLVSEDLEPYQHPNYGYSDNNIKTTKYTLWSFLPKNLFEQFHRFANMYFVFIALLNWVPVVNAIAKEIAMIPLLFVLSVTAVKDAFEDWRRYRSDKTINHQPCRVYSRSERRYVRQEWREVRVGDIVHLSCNEVIPADMVLLRSSDDAGICHIDTANIDGEDNLKQRNIIKGLKQQGSEFHPTLFTHTIECELPSIDIYKFHGALLTTLNEKIPVSNNNLLLRGCIIRNTDYVEAIVVYAGHETKAMLNNRGPRYKRSKLERQINRDVVWCVIILFIMCFGCACASGNWLNQFRNSTEVMYVPYESLTEYSPIYQGSVRFWTFIILYQVMIPLSLYVTIELVKLGQVYFIHQDVQLFHPPSNKRVECRALNITEDLGQVQYVFSDKTGTLTENKMVFKKCTIGGKEYSSHSQDDFLIDPLASGLPAPDFLSNSTSSQKTSDPFVADPNLQRELCAMSLTEVALDLSPHTERIHDFFLLLAVCNTVVVSAHEHLDLMDASGNLPGCDSLNSSFADHRPLADPAVIMTTPVTPDPQHSLDRRYMRLRETSTPLSDLNNPIPRHMREPVSTAAASGGTPEQYTRLKDIGVLNAATLGAGAGSSPSSRDSFNRRLRLKLPAFLHGLSPMSSNNSYSVTSRSSAGEDGGGGGSVVDDSSTDVSVMSENTLKTRYEAESPDELALVKAACSYGCRLVRRTPEHASVWLPGEGATAVEVLHILPFDSFRKRMSVIIRHPITKEINLLCKGADTNIYTCLRPDHNDNEHGEMKAMTTKHLTEYAKLGLRTLCMAKKVLSNGEYQAWLVRHQMAENALQHRERLLHESACRIEQNLTLLGATGIEDRLQENVPETIFALRRAGMKVWVLTGDKQETALNIAYSAKLFSFEQQLIVLNAKNKEMAETLIHSKLEFLESLSETASAKSSSKQSSATDLAAEGVAMVIDGKTLGFALDGELSAAFLRLAKGCSSVLCVRATPFQKAAMVKLVRDKLDKLTLAIGDGANDVSMIQTADIGIGLCGEEGMQAVMSSDFSLARFCFLQRLLLVHGHWCYDRLARMTLYMWYKNAVFIFMLMWFQFYSGFSGGTFLDDFNLILFNLVFTSVPPIMFGVLEKDISADALMAHPRLYKQGPMNWVYKRHSYFVQIADALWQSLMEFFVPYWVYIGTDIGMWEFGFTANTTCVYATLLHLCMETKSWHVFHLFGTALSLALYYGINLLIAGACVTCSHPSDPYWVVVHTLCSPEHWCSVVLGLVLAITPRYVIRGVQGSLHPGAVNKQRIADKDARRGSACDEGRGGGRGDNYYAKWSSTSATAICKAGEARGSTGTEGGCGRVGQRDSSSSGLAGSDSDVII